MTTPRIGDSVTVDDGPMAGLYGVVVYFYDDREQYLVRFSGGQQLYFDEHHILPWSPPTG